MANVMFKRGTQKNIAKFLATGASQAIDGAFYLTSDTNRLYVGKDIDGNGNIKAVPVNQGVITVDSISKLPSKTAIESGQFYYATLENVLCVYSGTQWVQINPDTNTKLSARSTTGTTDTDFIVITDIVTQSDYVAGEPVADTDDSFTSKFAVKGTDGVNVSVEEYTDGTVKRPRIVISQDAYTLKTSIATGDVNTFDINLTDGHSSDKITFIGGDGVTFKGTDDEKVTINVHNTTLSGEASNSLSFDANGNLTSTIMDSDGYTVTDSVMPIIQYAPDDKGAATETAKFISGTAALNVYSKAQIDDKLRTLDAMTYMGTIGTGGKYTSIPTSEVKKGYTYKFISEDSIVIDGKVTAVNIGDVIIANGTEGSDGYLGTISWDLIPSGDDAQHDTTYWVESLEAGTKLVEADGSPNGNSKGGIQLVTKDSSATKETYLNIFNDSSTATAGTKNITNKVVIEHKEQDNLTAGQKTVTSATNTSELRSDFTFKVPVLTLDKAGHITKVEEQSYTVQDAKYTYELEHLKITESNSSYDNNGGLTASATVQASLIDTYLQSTSRKQFNITSSSLTLNADGDNLVMNIEWGTF